MAVSLHSSRSFRYSPRCDAVSGPLDDSASVVLVVGLGLGLAEEDLNLLL